MNFTSFPWSLVYLVVSIIFVLLFVKYVGAFVERMSDRVKDKVASNFRDRAPKRESSSESHSEYLAGWQSPFEKDTASLASFFIAHGGIDVVGLDGLFSQIDNEELDEEKLYLALKHYGAGEMVPILREARTYYDTTSLPRLDAENRDEEFKRYQQALREFGQRIVECKGIEVFEEAYETRAANLFASNKEL